MSGPALVDLVSAGAQGQDAVAINDHIFMSRGVSNCYLVGTGSGALLVNTGLPHEAESHRDRFARACDERIRAIVFTQSHGDHVGGWTTFNRSHRQSSPILSVWRPFSHVNASATSVTPVLKSDAVFGGEPSCW